MNIAILQGRPTADPVIKTSDIGVTYCRVRIAVEGPYRGPNVPKRDPQFFTAIFFGKMAQRAYNGLGKGALCTVLGRLDQREYIDKNGERQERVSIVADKLTIHQYERRHKALHDVSTGELDEELLVPREIADSLFRQIDLDDEDIPVDLGGIR